MGKWGMGAFESDAVMDWYCVLKKQRDRMPPEVLAALEWVNDNWHFTRYHIGFAAAEIVAALGGHPLKSDQFDMLSGAPVDPTSLTSYEPTSNVIRMALKAVDMLGKHPEIHAETSADENDVKEWLANVRDLRKRLEMCLFDQERKEQQS